MEAPDGCVYAQCARTSARWVSADNPNSEVRKLTCSDSGVGVHLFVNGKKVCSSIPIYSKVDSRGKNEAEHFTIQEMPACTNSLPLKAGDLLQVKASYDVEKYPQ